MSGIFTISLDFELHWGVFDKRDRDHRRACYQNTLRLIPRLLELFADNEVHVTWATVGSLLARDWQEWEQMRPAVQPRYAVSGYSAYRWVEGNGLAREYEWAHFAPREVEAILQCPGQELGSHTFSHYYCLEEQHESGAFRADLDAMNRAMSRLGRQPVSLVFPRNQFNSDYLRDCYAYGIRAVRSNPSGWFWTPVMDKGSSIARKLLRTADAYVPVRRERASYPLEAIRVRPGEPLQLPASRFLRPWRDKWQWANGLRLRRICGEIRAAAAHGECYHLWWHPENFGDRPEENLKGLRTLLLHYRRAKERYGMTSWNMGEYVTNLVQKSSMSPMEYPQLR